MKRTRSRPFDTPLCRRRDELVEVLISLLTIAGQTGARHVVRAMGAALRYRNHVIKLWSSIVVRATQLFRSWYIAEVATPAILFEDGEWIEVNYDLCPSLLGIIGSSTDPASLAVSAIVGAERAMLVAVRRYKTLNRTRCSCVVA